MATLLFLCAMCTTIQAHMQLLHPSPFRDPHANRANEPKDYDILKPLHADGSDFACKGYHLNTPWTPVATYEAGGTYKMQLGGSATHGGGSCQLSLSFDGGDEFRVIKSMEGGCPEQKEYNFTVPAELSTGVKGTKTTGLFAWTWCVAFLSSHLTPLHLIPCHSLSFPSHPPCLVQSQLEKKK
jgi:hypothetical protein